MSKSRAKLVCAMPSEEVFRRRQRTPSIFLFDNANEVQGERRAKLVCAMLSRSLHSLLQLVCESKIKHKKKVYEETSYTSKGISKGSKGIPKP